MASFYHAEWNGSIETNDGTKWCSSWLNNLMKAGTEVTITANNGLTGRSKCTWFIKVEDGTVGPGIYVKSASWTAFFLNWIEWPDAAGLGSDSVLPVADGANY